MEAGPRVIRDDVVNARGELTFAEQTRMIRGPVPGAERLERDPDCSCKWSPVHGRLYCDHCRATPDDDPWYDVLPGPPVLPDVDTSRWNHHKR